MGVEGVPVVQSLVVELARRVLPRQWKQLRFIECVDADGIRRPRHHLQVGVTDVTVVDRLLGLRHLVEPLAYADSVPRHRVGDVAVEAHPVARIVEARAVPELGLGELSSQACSLELEDVDQVLGLDELASNVLIGAQPLRVDHENIIQTDVRNVKISITLLSPPGAMPSNLAHHPPPLSQPFFYA